MPSSADRIGFAYLAGLLRSFGGATNRNLANRCQPRRRYRCLWRRHANPLPAYRYPCRNQLPRLSERAVFAAGHSGIPEHLGSRSANKPRAPVSRTASSTVTGPMLGGGPRLQTREARPSLGSIIPQSARKFWKFSPTLRGVVEEFRDDTGPPPPYPGGACLGRALLPVDSGRTDPTGGGDCGLEWGTERHAESKSLNCLRLGRR